MTARVTVMVALPWGWRARLAEVVAAGKAEAAAISASSAFRPPRTATGAQRARLRGELAGELAARRRGGELLDTIAAALECGARRELAALGWDRQEWPEVPGDARLAGRWPGSRDRGYPEHVSAPVDAALVEHVLRACWHTSAPAITQLREWRDAHPGLTFNTGALDHYDELAASVTTTGALWRAGLRHVLPSPSTTPADTASDPA